MSGPAPQTAGTLAGKIAVVTGASKGIGRAIAIRLATAGADVFLHAHANHERLSETAAIIAGIGRQSKRLLGDLAEEADRDCLIEAAFAWQNHIDIWVNNAGADVLTGDLANRSFNEKLIRLWSVDVRATIDLSRCAGQKMKSQGDGCMVNIGWDQAGSGMAGDSGEMFAATKGAIMSFTRSLAKSLAPIVRVNCVAPGWIRTEWGVSTSPEWDARAQRESLLGRWGTPEDVAAAVCFLASPEAAFLNGQILEVNGGFRGAEPW